MHYQPAAWRMWGISAHFSQCPLGTPFVYISLNTPHALFLKSTRAEHAETLLPSVPSDPVLRRVSGPRGPTHHSCEYRTGEAPACFSCTGSASSSCTGSACSPCTGSKSSSCAASTCSSGTRTAASSHRRESRPDTGGASRSTSNSAYGQAGGDKTSSKTSSVQSGPRQEHLSS